MKKAISLILAFTAFNLKAQTPTTMPSGLYKYTHNNYNNSSPYRPVIIKDDSFLISKIAFADSANAGDIIQSGGKYGEFYNTNDSFPLSQLGLSRAVAMTKRNGVGYYTMGVYDMSVVQSDPSDTTIMMMALIDDSAKVISCIRLSKYNALINSQDYVALSVKDSFFIGFDSTGLNGSRYFSPLSSTYFIQKWYIDSVNNSDTLKFWKLGGNYSLDSTKYLGTNDSTSLYFSVVGKRAGRISRDSAGVVSFGKYSAVATTGGSNTAFGWSALRSTTTGNDNTAIGNSALKYSTGNQNTAIGARALSSLVTGSANVAIGRTSLQMAANVSSTVAIGTQAMQNRVSGAENTAIGHTALGADTSGGNNTAVGSSAMRFHIGGSDNTAVGRSALIRATSGSQNTGIGSMALDSVTGSNNIGIGYQARVPNNAASNQIRLGNASITYAGIEVAWTVTSDSSAKTNVTASNLGLGFINSLHPVSYNRKTENGYFALKEYGLIAQEVKQALTTAGITDSGVVTEAGEGKLAVRYNDLISVLIKAVQELTVRVETLENK